MPERERDDVGTTGDGLGEGANNEASSNGGDRGGALQRDAGKSESPGTIAEGAADTELAQASGGSVD